MTSVADGQKGKRHMVESDSPASLDASNNPGTRLHGAPEMRALNEVQESLPQTVSAQIAGKRASHPPRGNACSSSQGQVARAPITNLTPSLQEGSCNAATWNDRDNVNVSGLKGKDNENKTQPLTNYSHSANMIQSVNDADSEDSDEDYLDPILEREIELEFETMWKSQLNGDDSNYSESPTNNHIETDPNEINNPKSPYGPPGDDPICIVRLNTQSPTQEHGDNRKTPMLSESSTPEASSSLFLYRGSPLLAFGARFVEERLPDAKYKCT
ncbi:hypothetical protein J5N97_028705 [Dioscorea zingiberensis]|uniref:Uncharacterized protein n=1 Tax=Dioscorea zingiberensis TaxID=325984 RepID=A0A9D5BZF4_9LILI|nr:hypothetical protein J5N97_028705 [Dioscorea zingiberensis]